MCPYGQKCQFAHGVEELRERQARRGAYLPAGLSPVAAPRLATPPPPPVNQLVPHQPRTTPRAAQDQPLTYKTKLCRSFARTGKCPYGPRCRFVHGDIAEAQQLAVQRLVGEGIRASLQSPSLGANGSPTSPRARIIDGLAPLTSPLHSPAQATLACPPCSPQSIMLPPPPFNSPMMGPPPVPSSLGAARNPLRPQPTRERASPLQPTLPTSLQNVALGQLPPFGHVHRSVQQPNALTPPPYGGQPGAPAGHELTLPRALPTTLHAGLAPLRIRPYLDACHRCMRMPAGEAAGLRLAMRPRTRHRWCL